MHSLNAIQAWQFRRHQEKAWPLDYWLKALLPFSAVIWLGLVLAILKRTDQTFADLGNSFLARFLRGVATFMLQHGWLPYSIIGLGAVLWMSWSTGHLWRGKVGHHFQDLHDKAGRNRWWSACLLVSGIFIVAVVLAARRLVAADWRWWIAVAPLLLMSWWVFMAFHRPEGPRLWQIMLWRAASIALFVTSLVLMFPNAAEKAKDERVSAVAKELEEAARKWGLPEGWQRSILRNPPVPMTEEQRQVNEEVPIKFGEAKTPPPGAGKPPGTEDVGKPKTNPAASSDDSEDPMTALLRLLGMLFLLFGSDGDDGGGGDTGVAEEMVASTLGKIPAADRAAAVEKLKSQFGEKSRAARVIDAGAAHVGAAPGSTQGPGVAPQLPNTSAPKPAQEEDAKKKANP